MPFLSVSPSLETYWKKDTYPALQSMIHQNKIKTESLTEKYLLWLHRAETPFLLKIGSIALPIISLVTAGFLMGSPILFPAVAMGASLFLLGKGLNHLNGEIAFRMNKEIAFQIRIKKTIEQSISEVKDALGGEAAFEKIEIFNPTVYFDQMQPRLLPPNHSVARGLYCPDSTGIDCHAIACKIRLKQECLANLPPHTKSAEDALEPFVMTFSEEPTSSISIKKKASEETIKYKKWMWRRGPADDTRENSSFIKISKGTKPSLDEIMQAYRFSAHLARFPDRANFKESCDFLRGLIEGSDPYFELVPNEANPDQEKNS